MIIVREQILARIATIIGTLGAEFSGRNVLSIPDTRLPAIVLYDGDDPAKDNPRATSGRPTVVHMTPQIVVKLGDVPESIGTITNQWLADVQSAILGDEILDTLCGNFQTSGARYAGADTTLHVGRSNITTLTISFEIGYHLRPDDLDIA